MMMRKCQIVARKGGQCRTIKYLLRAELKYSGYEQAIPAIAWQSHFVLDILLYSYLLIRDTGSKSIQIHMMSDLHILSRLEQIQRIGHARNPPRLMIGLPMFIL
jgi:hypothetical protein